MNTARVACRTATLRSVVDKISVCFCAVLAAALLTCFVAVATADSVAATASGDRHLVLVGGGPTPATVFQRALDLSGGRRAIVAVVPQTYPDDSMADGAVTLWKGMRAREVIKVDRDDPTEARDALERASLIWIPGGYPSYLMRSIRDGDLPALIRDRFAAGVTIGGASAGAVAMSRTMLSDDANPDGTALGSEPTEAGLGLWPEAIVSPHFTERRRLAPFIPIMRAHPDLIGVGIDEGTAIIVSGGAFEVLGRGTVSVLEDGHDKPRVLRAGSRYRLARAGQTQQ